MQISTHLIPRGQDLTKPQPDTAGGPKPAPGQVNPYQAKFDVASPPTSPFDVVMDMRRFAPGAWSPALSHGGQTVVTVVEGEVTRRASGTETTFKAGEKWMEAAGEVGAVGNAGSAQATLLETILLPQGAQAVTQQGGALPRTVGSGAWRWWPAGWLALLAGVMVWNGKRLISLRG